MGGNLDNTTKFLERISNRTAEAAVISSIMQTAVSMEELPDDRCGGPLNLKTAMDSIAEYIKEERDVLYLRGQEREQMKFVKNLLTETDFSLDKIAKVAGVTVDFVKSIQRQLTGK